MDYVRVVYGKVSACIELDGRIRAFSDVAKAAAIEILGRHVAIGALSLRGPVACTNDLTDAVLGALELMDTLSLASLCDPQRVTGGAWFLLGINLSFTGESRRCETASRAAGALYLSSCRKWR